MNSMDFALVFKGLSHILYNQRIIMETLNVDNVYAINDTEELAVYYSKLAKMYQENEYD